MINNEDLGKTFEKALCIYSGIDFDGNFKYSVEKATDISNDLKKRLPKDLIKITKHTGKIDNSFDFINENNNGLSVKTGKNKLRNYKLCPQIIGQTTKNKFREYFKIDEKNHIKTFIYDNIPKLLDEYFNHTFHCDLLCYFLKDNKLIFIQKKNDKKINWKNYEYQFTKKTINLWHESNTLKVKFNDNFISIGEFQIHNHRNCIKFRFNFQKILEIFKDFLEIKEY